MKIALIIFSAFVICTHSLCASKKLSGREEQAVRTVLGAQITAWNEGNLEKFMETYFNSPELVFIGRSGPTYGWKETLENYKKGYPDKAAMGRLYFDILRISPLGRKTVFLIGKYKLSREKGDLWGHFSLVIRKIKGRWFIISDHSSASG